MSYNLYRQFVQLLPDQPLQVGTVEQVSQGRVVVSLPGGATVNLLGDAAVGQKVFFRDGAVVGPAPALTTILIEV